METRLGIAAALVLGVACQPSPDHLDPGLPPPCTPPSFATPVAAAAAPAVIVTNAALASAFTRLAALHTATGLPTEVLLVESICQAATCSATDPRHDTAKAIKDALEARVGLKYVVLGGGVEVVPSRQVHDTYANPVATQFNFTADFVTDYYYSDFSEWDTNGDGVYAQKGVDQPGYVPSVAVSRIPVHTPAEAALYVAKVLRHLTAYDGAKAKKALLLANVATEYNGLKIDSAMYLEAGGRTRSLLPADFAVQRLYANLTPPYDATAGTYSAATEEAALLDGQNLVVHSGHADTGMVTVEYDGSEAFTGARAFALTNAHLPIFLSCGCLAGDYSVAGHAGEQLLLAPRGGAIAYLGNAPLGLGIAGGMQFIDELLRAVQATPSPLLADAYLAAHQNLPKTDAFRVPLLGAIPVVDQSSWQWTQKGVTLLGDELIPVWKAPLPPAPALTLLRSWACQGTQVTVNFSAPATGTLRVVADGALYQLELSAQTGVTLQLAGAPANVSAGLASPASQYAFSGL